MSYLVTARKWRPMVFDDVIGQSHISNTLRNALAGNRLAHAFIFTGGRGCGKTTTARILAKAVNCLHPKNFDPCNECEICEEINAGRSLDIIEIDGASTNSVDDIRSIKEAVRYAPSRGGKRVYIIDEVHMLSKGAFNALLKTLEEPPEHVIFIFATTEIQRVPTTIISRCQRYDFRRISIKDIMSRLRHIAGQETISIDDDALLMIAKKADGAMRDAQSLFDQAVSFCDDRITAKQLISVLNIVDLEYYFRVTDVIAAHDSRAALQLVDDVVRTGYDLKEFVSGIAEHLRNLLIARTTGSTRLIEAPEVHRAQYATAAEQFTEADILRLSKLTTDTEASLRYHSQPRFALEVALVQMAKISVTVDLGRLLQDIEALRGVPRPVAPTVPAHKSPAVSEEKTLYVPQSTPNPFESNPVKSFTGKENEPVRVPQPPPASKISFEQLRGHWDAFVESAKRGKIGVGTILEKCSPLDVHVGVFRIACTDEYHLSTLRRNQQYLTQLFCELSGVSVAVNPILHKANAPVLPSVLAVATTSSPATPEKDHPLLGKLYRDFGAEKV
ncbi:MAG: DNA polymerase III subunit gamma/tau [Ignavibacteriales bacterium]|nr:DNA polymerase III subunit gamma/tau [Ignavibacteriales bacterium]